MTRPRYKTEDVEPGLQLNEYALDVPSRFDRPYLRFSTTRQNQSVKALLHDVKQPPDLETLKARYELIGDENQQAYGSQKFNNALQGIRQLLIFDCFFRVPAMRFLRNCLDPMPRNLTHVFILSGLDQEGEEETRKLFNEIIRQRQELSDSNHFTFELLCKLNRNQPPFPHDRFALLDGELWHFGATVGGTYKRMNAFSYGWRDSDVQFSQFFKDTWDSLDGQGACL